MFHRAGSILLVLLVLGCLQFHTRAQNANTPSVCCFGYYTRPIPIRKISAYETTRPDCAQPGVVFTITDGKRVCVNPDTQWVAGHIQKLAKRQ